MKHTIQELKEHLNVCQSVKGQVENLNGPYRIKANNKLLSVTKETIKVLRKQIAILENQGGAV
jgi:hypothetical protein